MASSIFLDLTTGIQSFAGASVSGNILFSPDNTYDIGASGASRPLKAWIGSGGVNTSGVVAGVGFSNSATSYITWTGRSLLRSPSNGVITISDQNELDFARLQFGGTTSAFPSIRRAGTDLWARLADDSGYATFAAFQYKVNNTPTFVGVPPSFSAGFGTSPSLVSGTATAFRWNVGTGAAASTGTITIGATATTGWNCTVNDLANAATHVTVQTASTTTTASFASYSRTTGLSTPWPSGAVIAINATGF